MYWYLLRENLEHGCYIHDRTSMVSTAFYDLCLCVSKLVPAVYCLCTGKDIGTYGDNPQSRS
ncbi:hypothetical protein T01_6846, partial [Trichinella spiralis]